MCAPNSWHTQPSSSETSGVCFLHQLDNHVWPQPPATSSSSTRSGGIHTDRHLLAWPWVALAGLQHQTDVSPLSLPFAQDVHDALQGSGAKLSKATATVGTRSSVAVQQQGAGSMVAQNRTAGVPRVQQVLDSIAELSSIDGQPVNVTVLHRSDQVCLYRPVQAAGRAAVLQAQVIQIDNFLSPAQCDQMVALIQRVLHGPRDGARPGSNPWDVHHHRPQAWTRR